MAGPIARNEVLGNALRFAELQHGVISQNIANVSTPGYRAVELSFDEFLSAAGKHNSASHPTGGAELRRTEGLPVRADGNNVDLDREVARLRQNSLLYRTFAQLMMSQMDIMRRAMSR